MTLVRPKLIIFDCDGTLTDSRARIVAATCHAFREEGLEEPTRNDICHQVGLPLQQMMYHLCQRDDMDLLHRLAEHYRKAIFDLKLPDTQISPLFPGCESVLEQLHDQGYLLGVATGMGRCGLMQVLKNHGIGHLFKTLKTADDGPGKPNPDILLDSMGACGVEAKDTVIIGDTTHDMMAGTNARILCIGVDWGYHTREALLKAGAVKVISDFEELPDLLTAIFAE